MAEYHRTSTSSVTIGRKTYSSGTATQQIQNQRYSPENISASSPSYVRSYSITKAPISVTNLMKAGGKAAVNKVATALGKNSDMGGQIIKGATIATKTTYAYFKGVSIATPIVVKGVMNLPENITKTAKTVAKVGKGVYQITLTTALFVVTVKKSLPHIKGGFVSFENEFKINAMISGLNNTDFSKKILSRIKRIQTKITTVKDTVKDPTKLKQKSIEFGKRTIHKAKNQVGNTSRWVFKKGIPNAFKASYKISLGVGGALARSEDESLKMTGNAIRVATYTVKTSVVATRVSGRTIKTLTKAGYHTVKNTYKVINSFRNNGFKKTLSKIKDRALSAVANAGRSMFSALINSLKSFGKKIVIPLIVGVAIIALVISLFGGAAGAVGYYLSGDFIFDNGDGTFTLTDIKTFLYNNTVEYGLPIEREKEIDYIEYIAKLNLKTNTDILGEPVGIFDGVEFRIEYDDYYVDITETDTAREKIAYRFYTIDELYEVVQPIFYAALLAEHDLEPSKEEAIETLEGIFKKIFDHEKNVRTKLCYGGSHSCGLTHPISTCPNKVRIVHTEYTCNYCCKYTCEGHEQTGCPLQTQEGHICDENCKQETYTSFCEGCTFVCTGEDYCNGHLVVQYTWNMKDVEHFFKEYFEEPIQELEEEDERTAEEEERLSLLKDYYALSQAYLEG